MVMPVEVRMDLEFYLQNVVTLMIFGHRLVVVYYRNTPKPVCIFIMFCFYYYRCSITDLLLLESIKCSLVPGQRSPHELVCYVDFSLYEFSAREVKLEVWDSCSLQISTGDFYVCVPIGWLGGAEQTEQQWVGCKHHSLCALLLKL